MISNWKCFLLNRNYRSQQITNILIEIKCLKQQKYKVLVSNVWLRTDERCFRDLSRYHLTCEDITQGCFRLICWGRLTPKLILCFIQLLLSRCRVQRCGQGLTLLVHPSERTKAVLQTGHRSNKSCARKVNIDAPWVAPQSRSLALSGERRLRTVIIWLIPVRTLAQKKKNSGKKKKKKCTELFLRLNFEAVYSPSRSNVAQHNKGEQSNM